MAEYPEIFRFAQFEFDCRARTLIRSGSPVHLTPREYELLLALVRNAGSVVTTQHLIDSVWPDVAVTDNNLAQQISNLRRKLGNGPDNLPYIRTVARQGYFVPDLRAPESVINASSVRSRASTPPTSKDFPLIGRVSPRTARRLVFMTGSLAVLLVGAAAAIYVKSARSVQPEAAYTPLTSDGKPKGGPIVINGGRVYFQERFERVMRTVSVAATGGDAIPFETGLPDSILCDISADGRSMLLTRANSNGQIGVWLRTLPKERPDRLYGPEPGVCAPKFSPDGHLIAIGADRTLLVLSPSYPETPTRISLPGTINSPSWSPHGELIRFEVYRADTGRSSLWQYSLRDKRLEDLQFDDRDFDTSQAITIGGWTAGNLFVFGATRGHRIDTWISREGSGLFAKRPRSLARLAGDSSEFRLATGYGGTCLYAFGARRHGELFEFDPIQEQWHTAPGDTNASELSYSKNHRWVAYTRAVDHTLWRSRPDGTEPLELSRPGIEAHQPHWSPNSNRIAFMAYKSGDLARIYVVPAAGGTPEEIMPVGEQGVPTWSPDGNSLLFGELRRGKPPKEMCLHLLDLHSRLVASVPGSEGLWSPRWSPDGHHILAVTPDFQDLMLLSVPKSASLRVPGKWRKLVSMHAIQDAEWSLDSRYIYFRCISEPATYKARVYRIRIVDNRLESLTEMSGIRGAIDNWPGEWFGVTPEGRLLALRDSYSQELYSLRLVGSK